MKLVITLLAMLCFPVIVLAEEATEMDVRPDVSVAEVFTITPTNHIYFGSTDGHPVGTLEFSNGILSFAGNADESARIFIEHYLIPLFRERCKEECSKIEEK